MSAPNPMSAANGPKMYILSFEEHLVTLSALWRYEEDMRERLPRGLGHVYARKAAVAFGKPVPTAQEFYTEVLRRAGQGQPPGLVRDLMIDRHLQEAFNEVAVEWGLKRAQEAQP